MTFLYFVSCSLITFLPLYVVYRATALHQTHGVIKNMAIGGGLYFLAQLGKLILIALAFSSFEDGPKFVAFHEITKLVLSSVDVTTLWYGFKQSAPTSGLSLRLSSLGLGWALGHHLAYYFPGFWIHARSLQFSYASTIDAVSSIAFLVISICLPFLTYLALKKREDGAATSVLAFLGLFFIFSTESITKLVTTATQAENFVVLGVQFACAALVAGMTKVAWNSTL